MVVGQTKFGPDDLSWAIVGVYQLKDTFNFGMLMKHVASCRGDEAYDGIYVLRDLKAAPHLNKVRSRK